MRPGQGSAVEARRPARARCKARGYFEDQFWGARFMSNSAADAQKGKRALALRAPSAAQVVAQENSMSTRTARRAPRCIVGQVPVRAHPPELENSSPIRPNPPPHAARVHVRSSGPLALACYSLPACDLVARSEGWCGCGCEVLAASQPARLGRLGQPGWEVGLAGRGRCAGRQRASRRGSQCELAPGGGWGRETRFYCGMYIDVSR